MAKKATHSKGNFENFAARITQATGSTTSFFIASTVVIVWLISGPFFNYSDTWQLVINTGTTIVTFLMVFLIQKTQNKDSIAIQIKLNELVASNQYASNRMVSVEDLTEEELRVIGHYYSKLSEMAKKDGDIRSSHSIDEAKDKHEAKYKARSGGQKKA